METREEQMSVSCGICGEDLQHEEREDVLCGVCVDTWEREVDSFW